MISTVDSSRRSKGPDRPGPQALPPVHRRVETGGAGGEWDERNPYAASGGRRGRLAVGPGGAAVRGRGGTPAGRGVARDPSLAVPDSVVRAGRRTGPGR